MVLRGPDDFRVGGRSVSYGSLSFVASTYIADSELHVLA
jgi:hypothetical protein